MKKVPRMMNDVVIDLYQAGYSMQDIKHKLNLPITNIFRTLQGAGFRTDSYHNMEPQLRRVLSVLMKGPVFYRDLETYCDISMYAARDFVSRLGIVRPDHVRTYPAVPDEAYQFPAFHEFVNRYRAGESFPALVDDLHIPDDKLYSLFFYLWRNDMADEHRQNLVAQVKSQLDAGFPSTAVAHQEHISPAIVRRIARGERND